MNSTGTETIDQRIKRRIGELRVRETLAQLILMLEIVALEAASVYKPPSNEKPTADEAPSDQAQAQVQEEAPSKPSKREKKLNDINIQLDLLLDKLCIWHATEEAGILDFDTRPQKDSGSSEGGARNGANDRFA